MTRGAIHPCQNATMPSRMAKPAATNRYGRGSGTAFVFRYSEMASGEA
jgi:hypothetical protein